MRGIKVALHQHFDGTRELRWRKPKFSYTFMTKAQRQTIEVDSKRFNDQVDKALTKRKMIQNTGHKSAAIIIWRNISIGKSATDEHHITL